MELDSLAEVELIGHVVDLLPLLGEHGDEVVLLVESEKGVVDMKAHSGRGHFVLDDGIKCPGIVNVGNDESVLRQSRNCEKAQENRCGYCQKCCFGAGVFFHSVISFG